MATKTIYRTIIKVEVLSPEPIEESQSLYDTILECDTGDNSGRFNTVLKNEPLTGLDAVKKIKEQGSDPVFFEMDENGNQIEE